MAMSDPLCHATTLSRADTATQRELLLQVYNKDQQQTEQQLDRLTRQIKLQYQCTLMVLINTLTRHQLALLFVQSYPFMPDPLAICEAFEDGNWI
eukprot:gene8677-8858_t